VIVSPWSAPLLRFGVGKIFALRDRPDRANRAGRLVDDRLETLSVLRRVDGKLELAGFNFEF
jgi:hypothetical protein